MAAFFAHTRGSVVRIDSVNRGGPLPFAVRTTMPGFGGVVSPTSRLIITQTSTSDSVNYQMTQTMGEAVYAFIFGDMLGELSLTGVAFSRLCGADGDGVEQLLAAYDAFKLSARGRPLMVNLGNITFRALLVGSQLSLADPEMLLAQWSLKLLQIRARR